MPALIGSKPLSKTEIQRRYRAKQKRLAVESNARRNEWGTPPALLEAVRTCFGGQIDCDPATHAEAQERVQALTYYTAETDGLAVERGWHGKIFLNPPYQRGLVDKFVFKLLVELVSGRATEAIVLVNAQTDTVWFQSLKRAAAVECNPAGRVRFLNSEGRPGMPLVGQALFYFGSNQQGFFAAFSRFGVSTVLMVQDAPQWSNRSTSPASSATPNPVGLTPV